MDNRKEPITLLGVSQDKVMDNPSFRMAYVNLMRGRAWGIGKGYLLGGCSWSFRCFQVSPKQLTHHATDTVYALPSWRLGLGGEAAGRYMASCWQFPCADLPSMCMTPGMPLARLQVVTDLQANTIRNAAAQTDA